MKKNLNQNFSSLRPIFNFELSGKRSRAKPSWKSFSSSYGSSQLGSDSSLLTDISSMGQAFYNLKTPPKFVASSNPLLIWTWFLTLFGRTLYFFTLERSYMFYWTMHLLTPRYVIQDMRYEFGSAGAFCSIKESSGPQNQRVHIVLKGSKSAGVKGDVPKICAPVLTHSLLVTTKQ